MLKGTCAIDGTTMLGREVGVCYWVGSEPYVALDWEPVLKGENEIQAAKRLLPRVLKRFGWAIQTVVGDGLYTGWFFRICLEHGKHAVTTLREDDARGLKIIEQARARLRDQVTYGVAAEPGVDEDGPRSYELRELGALEALDLPEKVRVLWYRQQELKGQKRQEERWLMTTLNAAKVPAVTVRKLGRSRSH